jgi:hypothetical protein
MTEDEHDNELFDDGAASRVLFDRFEIDEAEARLSDGGQPVHLRPSRSPCCVPLARTPHYAHHQERAARRRLGPPVRQRVGAEDEASATCAARCRTTRNSRVTSKRSLAAAIDSSAR